MSVHGLTRAQIIHLFKYIFILIGDMKKYASVLRKHLLKRISIPACNSEKDSCAKLVSATRDARHCMHCPHIPVHDLSRDTSQSNHHASHVLSDCTRMYMHSTEPVRCDPTSVETSWRESRAEEGILTGRPRQSSAYNVLYILRSVDCRKRAVLAERSVTIQRGTSTLRFQGRWSTVTV